MPGIPDCNSSIQRLFGLGLPQVVVDKTRVREVCLFAPGWDVATTRAMTGTLVDIRHLVFAASLCGMQDDEITDEIVVTWPRMSPVRVSTECQGTRVVIEVLEPPGNT